MLAHHAYDYIVGFVIAFAGILLIIWAERRARARHSSGKAKDRS